MNWASWSILGLYLIALLVAAYEHGKPRKPSRFQDSLVAVIILLTLFYFAGFFR